MDRSFQVRIKVLRVEYFFAKRKLAKAFPRDEKSMGGVFAKEGIKVRTGAEKGRVGNSNQE